jgi:hypothetical protein
MLDVYATTERQEDEAKEKLEPEVLEGVQALGTRLSSDCIIVLETSSECTVPTYMSSLDKFGKLGEQRFSTES